MSPSHEMVTTFLAIAIFLLAGISMGLYIYFEVKKGRRAPQISKEEWELIHQRIKDIEVWERRAYNILAPMQKWHYDNNTGFKEIQDAFRNQPQGGNGGKIDSDISK